MAISKNTQTNIDDSNPTAYPNGQVKDDDGTGDGFPLIRVTTSDYYETFDKLMRLADIDFNGDFDNENTGFQYVAALVALASKSDYIIPITTAAGVLGIATKLGTLKLNEKLIVQAVSDWTSETHIIGSDAVNLAVTITRQYKANDYLMMRRTSGGVTLVCLITADNLNLVVSENSFLKAANDATELVGTATGYATTPASNLSAFTKRVTDPTDAAPFLATDSTPGLMSAADKTALDGFSSPIINVGTFSGVDPGGGSVGSFYTPSGNVTSAQITFVGTGGGSNAAGGYTNILVTLQNAMADTNYFVRASIQSQGTLHLDNTILTPVFVPLTTTTFTLSIADSVGLTQNLKIIIEAVQLS